MDPSQTIREVRKRQWLEIIRDRNNSGETVRGYCSARGISEKTYYYWQRRLREAVCQELAEQHEHEVRPIVELPLQEYREPAVSGRIIVRIGNAEMEIQGDMQPALVESVLRVLGC